MSWSTQERKQESCSHFDYGAITLWGFAFQQILLYVQFVTFRLAPISALQPLYMPHGYLLRSRRVAHTGLGSSPFARRYFGNNYCSFFLQVLRCFTSPGSLSASQSTQSSNCVSCLIRKSWDQRLLHASPTLIAATPRPSSPLSVKASTIHPWVLLGTQKTIFVLCFLVCTRAQHKT